MDFDRQIDRSGTGSLKWDRYRNTTILPMWVADMDFESPPEVIEALQRRVNHRVMGYTNAPQSTVEAVCAYMETHHGYPIDPDWLVWSPGMVPSLNLACRAYADPGQGIMTFTPSYPPFLTAPGYAGRELQGIPMLPRADDSGWEVDWERMERTVHTGSRVFLLSNPQNPVGKVFSRDELERLGEFCIRHDLVLCSDEIHCDLILNDAGHICAGTLSPEIVKRTVMLLSPSKTYNLAGLACAFLIIPDATLRARFKREARGIITEINLFGYAGCEAAYRYGESWRLSLLRYLEANRHRVYEALSPLPGLRLRPMEATYLAWMDLREWDAHPARRLEKAGVGLSDGSQFDAPGWVRLNFGCPGSLLEEALRRMTNAIQST